MSDEWSGDRSDRDGEDEPEAKDPGRDDPGGWDEPDAGHTHSVWAGEEPDSEQESESGWPTPGADWQRPGYGDYGYRREDLFVDEPEQEPFAAQHTRDPLARLFPGLPRSVRVTLDWILTIAGAILIVLALKQWVVNPYRIPSSSMEPTLNCATPGAGCLGNTSDRVLACRICLDFTSPSRGDIVVFNTPSRAALDCGEGGTFVKRVIGLPGDTVHEDHKGNIWIKSKGSPAFVKLKEPYISAEDRLADNSHFGITRKVPEGQYFMMGDNRSQSCDSRTWGAVPRNKLIGIVFFTYWPPNRISFH
jgi:signal peptidase I